MHLASFGGRGSLFHPLSRLPSLSPSATLPRSSNAHAPSLSLSLSCESNDGSRTEREHEEIAFQSAEERAKFDFSLFSFLFFLNFVGSLLFCKRIDKRDIYRDWTYLKERDRGGTGGNNLSYY